MIGVYDYTVIATYASLFVGLCGIFASMEGYPHFAVLALMLAGILDAFDGRIARTKKNRTEREKRFGIQIDSLNDLICFGVLPAVIGHSFGNKSVFFLAVLSFFVLAALIRLAYFNVTEEERQNTTDEVRKYYLGLPVTSTALLLPFFWMLPLYVPIPADITYAAALFVCGALFIAPVQIKKPKLPGILVMAAFGLLELAFLFYLPTKL